MKFEKFLNQEVGAVKNRDLLQITALVHDCGKITVFENLGPIHSSIPNGPDGSKEAPGHAYWGSIVVRDILKRSGLSDEVIEFIANCVRLHLAGWQCWSVKISKQDLLRQLKLWSENYHAEMIFNVYCDLFYNTGFKDRIHLPLELLNMPETYEPLKYAVMN